MQMHRLLALLIALSPALSFSADGDPVSASARQGFQVSTMFYLCDSKAAADESEDCDDLLIIRPGDTYIFAVNEDTGCSAYSVVIKHKALSDGDAHELDTLSNTGDSAVIVNSPLSQVLFATLTTLTDCTDFDLTVEVIHPERR